MEGEGGGTNNIFPFLNPHLPTIYIFNPKNISNMSNARIQAEKDIKESLRREGKVFIAFRSELNKEMDRLVKEQIRHQKEIQA